MDEAPPTQSDEPTPANATPIADAKTRAPEPADTKTPDAPPSDPALQPPPAEPETPSEDPTAIADATADPASPWWVVAHRKGASLAIGELVDGSVVLVTEVHAAVAPVGKPFGPLRTLPPEPETEDIGPSIAMHPALVERLGGRWPDDVWVVDLDHEMRAGSTWHVRHLTNDGWVRDTGNLEGVLVPVFSSLSPWKDGTVLAKKQWKTDEQVVPNDDYVEPDDVQATKAHAREASKYERRLKRAAAKAKPQLVVLGGTAAPPADAIASEPGEILSLPSGDVFTGCDAAGAFVHHAPDGTSTPHPLPASASTPLPNMNEARLLGHAIDHVYCLRSLGAKHHAARFDGKAWTEVPIPFEEDLVTAAVGRDGSLWALFGGDLTALAEGFAPETTLHRLGEDGSWHAVALTTVHAPEGMTIDTFTPIQLVVRNKDDIWIAGPLTSGDDAGALEAPWVVLHSRALGSVFEVPGR